LLAPKKLIQPELESQRLMYEFNGTKLAVDTLSSGERQVVNIAFDIILRSPSDSIFVIDEPELHLHPELSFKLIRTLQGIGENNQFVFFTHSADIISSSIDDTVLFMRPPNGGANQAVKAGRDDDATQGLKLLGHSIGVISLGRKIVLIEGEDASTDKKVYSSILGNGISDFVLLPVGSVQTLHNFEKIRERILDKAIWGVDFYMVCDHDAPYHDGILADDCAHPRLKKIGRYHIENYFLEEEILAQVFEDIDTEAEWLRDPARVNSELKSLAAQKLSYATALVVARDVWSRGGNVKILPKACDGANEVQLVDLVAEMANREIARVGQLLKAEEIVALTQSTYRTLQESLEGNDWKFKIPAKSVLRAFFAKAGIKDVHVKSLYIRKAQDSKNNPFKDIVEIFEYFRTGT
jgi:energy-coupling factor transporter ATP-binding protein EcfA2